MSPAHAAPALFVLWLPAPSLCTNSGISRKLPDSLTQSGVFGCCCADCSATEEVLIHLALLYTLFILQARVRLCSSGHFCCVTVFFPASYNNKHVLQMCRQMPRFAAPAKVSAKQGCRSTL